MTTEFKMVPVEPTEEMILAVEGDSYTFATGDEEWIGCLSSDMAEEIYKNMLGAAPASPLGVPLAIVVEQTHNYGNFLVFGSSIPGVQRPVPVVERKAHLLDQSLPTGTKLYAHADAGDVERLLDQLAEARKIIDHISGDYTGETYRRIAEFLAATANPDDAP